MSDNERIVNGYTIKPGADLRGRDLREFDLRGCDLRGCNLRGCDLRGCDLREFDLRGCDLAFAKLPLGLLWSGDMAPYRVAVGYGCASVGCQRHPYSVWRELTEATAREWSGERAVTWWRNHREKLLQIIAEAEAATPDDQPKEGDEHE